MEFLQEITDQIRSWKLAPGSRVLVAFSAGPDSTALLHALNGLARKMKFQLRACYVNHRIRPRAVKNEIIFCREFCINLGIPFIIGDVDVPAFAKRTGLSVEEAAREGRHALLRKIARQENCHLIALGHHNDDLIETILMRLFRGTGPQGLVSFKAMNGNIVRPLLNISRKEILRYLKKNEILYMVDRTNLKSAYTRNFLRNKVIPRLEEKFGGRFKSSLLHLIEIISEENDFLQAVAGKAFKRAVSRSPGGKIIVDLTRLEIYDVWLKRRILKMVLEEITGRPGFGRFEEIARIEKIVAGQLTATDFSGGIFAARDKSSLVFATHRVQISPVPLGRSAALPMIGARLKTRIIPQQKACRKLQKGGKIVNLDYDKLIFPLQIRSLRPGDRFTPLGMTGSKKVGDFLTDRKTPRSLRDEIPLVLDQKGIVWVVGYQIADRCKIRTETRRVLEIEYIRTRVNEGSEI